METNEWSIRVKAAAVLLSVSPTTIHHYREQGLIEARRMPTGRFRLLRASVMKLVTTKA